MLEILEEKDSGGGAKVDVIVYNLLINGYCKAGDVDKGLELLDRMMVAPDVVTCNTLLKALCASGKLDMALELLERQIESKCYPDVFTFNILLEAVIKESGVGKGKEFLDEMKTRGCNPTLSRIVFLSRGFVRKEGWMIPSSSSIKCPRSMGVDHMRKLIAPLSNPCAALEGG